MTGALTLPDPTVSSFDQFVAARRQVLDGLSAMLASGLLTESDRERLLRVMATL